ncbi:hypothetical protein D1P53_003369 [Cryptococcus gattii VGV]|nr:hypothetical protein D1P53_003369 [Cryptococcus gattii VGV]
MFRATSRQTTNTNSTPEVKLSKRNSTANGLPSARYSFRLNFYERPPALDITLEEFETCAISRLRVLSHIESLSHRSLPYSQVASGIATYAKMHLPLSSNTARNVNLDEERRRDEIGHWVLRLAFCRSPDLRQRFVRSELALFKSRFETDDKNERAVFLKSLSFNYDTVDEDEKKLFKTELQQMLPKGTKEDAASETWFKVPWYTVPDLVGARRVLVKGGLAFVPQSLQLSLVLQAFADRLEKALEFTAKNLPRLDEDERLGPVIDHLASSFLSGIGASDYQPSNELGDGMTVTADTIDDVARKHFPPSLGSPAVNVGLGLPLDQAILFWRRSYGTSMTDDKFNKEYKYNIRHSYGQEGRRANYPPKNCQQILTQDQPGTQDSHGCPFRHFSPENLTAFLTNTYPDHFSRTSPEMRDVLDSVKASHYHLACTRVFEVTHGVKKGEGLGNGESVSHPNKWADRSRELEKEVIDGIKKKEEAMDVD